MRGCQLVYPPHIEALLGSHWAKQRTANLPGAAHRARRSPQGALEALRKYELANQDLPPQIVRLLGLSALSKTFGRKVLEEALGQKLPGMVFRDASWRWWNALDLSGLGWFWGILVPLVRTTSLREAARQLRYDPRTTKEQYLKFLRILGTNPHNTHRNPEAQYIWTKGGRWDVRSNLTKLLVLKEHLEPRPQWTRFQKKLGRKNVRQIEKELHRLVNPDAVLSYEARNLAAGYVKHRLPAIVGNTLEGGTWEQVAWFFDEPIPTPRGIVVYSSGRGYTLRSKSKVTSSWAW